jgi:hypothetical protein
MRWLTFLNRRLPGGPCLAVMYQSVALVIVLLACSTQPQSGPVAQVPPNSPQSEQCSLVGRLACAAMSSLSGDTGQDRQATCLVSRVAGKTVETCGFVETKPQTNEADRRPRSPDSVELAWSDNSNNEKNFVIERCDQVSIAAQEQKKIASCTGGWKTIATVGANITRHIDKTVAPNHTYLYRVRATNDFGASDPSNEMWITTPSN